MSEKPYVHLVWHMMNCLTCIDTNRDPRRPHCVNGARLLRECEIPPLPETMPPGAEALPLADNVVATIRSDASALN